MDKILKLNETAEMLRKPPATLRFWRTQGTGPRSFKIGRAIAYKESDVLAWLDEQYETTQEVDRDSA